MGVLGKGRKVGIPIQKNINEVGVPEVPKEKETEKMKREKNKNKRMKRTLNLKLLSLNLNESLTCPT